MFFGALANTDQLKTTSKLQWATESIGFIKKALQHEVATKSAQVKGNFINVNDRYKPKKCILLLHLNKNMCFNKLLTKNHHYLLKKLKQEWGPLLITITLYISTLKQKEIMNSFKTKNCQLKRMIQNKTSMSNYQVPIINVSDYKLSEIEQK